MKNPSDFETLLGKWEAACFNGLYSKLIARRYSQIWEHVRTLCPDVKKPGDLDFYSIQDYRALRIQAGYGTQTIALELAAIRAFYQWLQLQGHELSDPTIGIKP